MNKREVVLSLLDPDVTTPYVPAGFFLHFDKAHQHGKAAVEKHLEFFQYTGMDLVKIQYELSFPQSPKISSPKDWSMIPLYGEDFFEDQWHIARGLVEAVGSDALVIMTLYSPFMCAGQISGKLELDQHIRDFPENVSKGLEIITESLITFVTGCIEQGVDGFYHSTQGSESHRFGGTPTFNKFIKEFDLALMQHVNESSKFNILHICDYHGDYDDLSAFLDYPGDIINCSKKVGNKELTGHEISELFNRPYMGGLDRHGILVSGSKQEIQSEVETAINQAPSNFILGADCTLPGDIDWENIRTAISCAHDFLPE